MEFLKRQTEHLGMVISKGYIYGAVCREEERLLYVEATFKEARKDSLAEDLRRFTRKYSLEGMNLSLVMMVETKRSDERTPNMDRDEVLHFLEWEGDRLMPWDRDTFIADYIYNDLGESGDKQLYIAAVSRELLNGTIEGVLRSKLHLQVIDAWPTPATHIVGDRDNIESYVVALIEDGIVSLLAYFGSGLYDCIRLPMTEYALDKGMEAIDALFCRKGFPAPRGVMFSAIGGDDFKDEHYQARYLSIDEDVSPCLEVEEVVQRLEEHWQALSYVDLHISKDAKDIIGNVEDIQWQAALGLCIRHYKSLGKEFSYS